MASSLFAIFWVAGYVSHLMILLQMAEKRSASIPYNWQHYYFFAGKQQISHHWIFNNY
jgi:hypothetical protein